MSDTSSKPGTWFSGESSPEDQKQTTAIAIIAGLVFAVISPTSVIVILICWVLFTRARISHRVIGSIVAIYALLITVSGLIISSINLHLSSVNILLDSIKEDTFGMGMLGKALVMQIPLSILIGGVIGFGFCWWRYFRRPKWETVNFRRTPIEWRRRKKNISNIQHDNNGPENGATLGINDKTGVKIVQLDTEASAHTFVAGASGSGKTTTLMLEARDYIRRGDGYVFIDLKGGEDVPQILADLAERHGRKFYHWTIHDPRTEYTGPAKNGPAFYDPLGRGDASRRKDMIIGLRKWDNDYYQILAESYLQNAFDVSIAVPPAEGTDTLTDIIALLKPEVLYQRAKGLPTTDYYTEMRAYVNNWTTGKLDKNEKSSVDGVRQELQLLRGSSAGRWLRYPTNGGDSIDIKKVADEGSVVVFSLDSSTYDKVAPSVANLIVQDLKTVTSELRRNPSKQPIRVVIDEFSAMESENIIGLINKARDAKMSVSLSTQALGDLRKINSSFLDQLLGIINCFIIHRANTIDDAEIYAGLTGKGKRWETRISVEHTSGGILGGVGKGAATGAASVAEVDDFRVPAQVIQDLGIGQMIYLAKSPKQRFEAVRVIPEDGVHTSTEPNRPRVPESITPRKPFNPNAIYPGMPEDLRHHSEEGDDFTVTEEEHEVYAQQRTVRPTIGLRPQVKPALSIKKADLEEPKTDTYIPPVYVEPKPSSGFLNGRDLGLAMGRPSRAPIETAPQPSQRPTPSLPTLRPTRQTTQQPVALPRPIRQPKTPTDTPTIPSSRPSLPLPATPLPPRGPKLAIENNTKHEENKPVKTPTKPAPKKITRITRPTSARPTGKTSTPISSEWD